MGRGFGPPGRAPGRGLIWNSWAGLRLVAAALVLTLSVPLAAPLPPASAGEREARPGHDPRAGAEAPVVAAPGPRARRDVSVAQAQPPAGTELVALRTATSKTLTTSEAGVFETRVFPAPVHYRDGQGRWRDIDARLQPAGQGRFRAAANSFGLSLAADASAGQLARLELAPGVAIGWGLEGARPGLAAPAGRKGDEMLWRSALPHVDLELGSLGQGVKEDLILRSRAAADTFVLPLALEGLSAEIDDRGDLVFMDAAGAERARSPKGWMVDAAGSFSDGVTYTLVQRAEGQALVVRLDRAWLDDPARAYPVRVDPTTAPRSDDWDTFVQSNAPSTDFSLSPELRAGAQPGAAARSFLYFNLPGLAGKTHQLGRPAGVQHRVDVLRAPRPGGPPGHAGVGAGLDPLAGPVDR